MQDNNKIFDYISENDNIKRIKISHSIRGVSQNFGELPEMDLEIDLDKEYKDYKNEKDNELDNVIKKLNNILLSKLKEKNITAKDNIVLYAIAPNSILVSIAYILEKHQYHFNFLPKPKDSVSWGFKDIEIDEPELKSFIDSKSNVLRIDNIDHPIGIILSGKSNIDNIDQVYKDDKNLIINKGFDYSYSNIITITHQLILEEHSHKSLLNKHYYYLFTKKIDEIFEDILKYKNLKEVHILSSIPSNGLLYLGKKMASYEYDHLNFYIYNYSKDNDRYELGTILNTNLLEGC